MCNRAIILCIACCFQTVQTADRSANKRKAEQQPSHAVEKKAMLSSSMLPVLSPVSLHPSITLAPSSSAKPYKQLRHLTIPVPTTAKGPQSPSPDKSDFLSFNE